MGVAEKVEKGKGYCVGNMSRKGQKVTFSIFGTGSICCGETSHLMYILVHWTEHCTVPCNVFFYIVMFGMFSIPLYRLQGTFTYGH